MNNEKSEEKEKKISEQPEETKLTKEISEKLKKCEQEKDEYLNGWKRAKADFVNYQKDEAKRLEELLKFGQADLIKDCVAILDSFDLAIVSLEKDDSGSSGIAMKGIYMIRAQLEEILKKRGLERITVSAGKQFDPSLHEAIGEMESDQPAGAVAEEIERGYLLNGKVIRPARVKISKGSYKINKQ